MTIQGVGEVTRPQLMAEIGDVRRFIHKGALVAFTGMDAPPFQSGTFDSKSRRISKRGSPIYAGPCSRSPVSSSSTLTWTTQYFSSRTKSGLRASIFMFTPWPVPPSFCALRLSFKEALPLQGGKFRSQERISQGDIQQHTKTTLTLCPFSSIIKPSNLRRQIHDNRCHQE